MSTNALIIGLIRGLRIFARQQLGSSGSFQHLQEWNARVTFEVFLHFGTLISVFGSFAAASWK